MAVTIQDGTGSGYEAKVDEHNALITNQLNTFITEPFDYIALTYVAAGDGAGEIQTATYKTGGASGTTVGVLTLTYNGDDKLASVTKA